MQLSHTDLVVSPNFDVELDRPLDEKAAAEFCSLSHRTLQQLRQRGDGPAFFKLTSGPCGTVRYSRRALLQWIQSRLRRSTAEAVAISPKAPKPSGRRA
jgi:hypothetical protein